jgi:hypothetical protein
VLGFYSEYFEIFLTELRKAIEISFNRNKYIEVFEKRRRNQILGGWYKIKVKNY